MKNDPISITGLGLITPLGCDCQETFQALLDGKFIDHDARAKFKNGQQATVNELALAAAKQATSQAGWANISSDTAIIAGTSKGDIESWLVSLDQMRRQSPVDYPWQMRLGLCDLAATIAENLDARDSIRLTYSAACASALHALIRAVMMVRNGEIRRALVVAAESSLHPLFQGCFNRLGVRAAAGEPCRPFDINRHGFHISQAAAAICIESGESTKDRGIARIEHVALAGDACHLTGSDPAARTLSRLIQSAVSFGPPDLIHAHGTGTVTNDAAELLAIESVLPDASPLPILFSHKAGLGHSMGASGLISIVLNCLIHQLGIIPGNSCTHEAMPMQKLNLSSQPIRRDCRRSLVLASGFGGAASIVGLTKD